MPASNPRFQPNHQFLYKFTVSAYVHVKNRGNASTTEDSLEDEDFAEKESIESPSSDIFDATENTSPSSLLEFAEEFEQNSVSSDTIIDAPPVDEISLPSKYKNIIKGFVSHLKDKFNPNSSKNE